MERNANYALVGFAAMLLTIGLIVFVVWLARLQFSQDYDKYDILFIGPVRGLSDGGEVHFNGIKVGEVTKIELDKVDPNHVVAHARVTSDVPIRVDSFATLEPQGITGVNYVQITAGTPSKPLLKDTVKFGETPIIQTQAGALADLLNGSGAVLAKTVEALDRVNKVLSNQNIAAFSATLADVRSVAAEINTQKMVLADADKAILAATKTAEDISALSKSSQNLLDGDGRKALKQMGDAADALKAAAADARTLVNGLKGPTSDFATTGLPQLTAAIASLQSSAESLDRLVGNIEQDPRALVTKPAAREVEVKP
jgi:phospholipid/cholesterol/gamma-HCH transport system substrate-binding protein